MLQSLKSFAKAMLKLSPIPLSQNHRYDLQTKRIIKRELKATSNCLDVGCHKGEILDLMLAAAPQGQHIGFEPIPMLADALSAKFANQPNCSIHTVALSNAEGFADFNYVVSNPSYSGLVKRDYDRAGEVDESIRVRTARLDDEIPAGMRVDLLKIDVEGGELLVLEGATRVLAEHKPLVIFEHGLGASEHYGSSPEKVFAVLAKAGLSIYTLDAFLKNGNALDLAAFSRQYHERLNYYFVAKG